MAAQRANFRMEPGSDAMKQRMQAMMRYNRLRQETRASNAVLQVKRKHQRREPVDPRADETSLERQQMQDRSYYEYGCVTDGLRADLGLERGRRVGQAGPLPVVAKPFHAIDVPLHASSTDHQA